jgi:hypothetical protein
MSLTHQRCNPEAHRPGALTQYAVLNWPTSTYINVAGRTFSQF